METEKTEQTEETKVEEKKPEESGRVQIRDLTNEGAEKNKELRFTKRVHMVWKDEDGFIHEGDFTIKRPTIGESTRIGVLMAEMRQDKPIASIDYATSKMQERIATCIVCVTQAPPWWDPENMYDEEPIVKLYALVVAYWNSFRNKVG